MFSSNIVIKLLITFIMGFNSGITYGFLVNSITIYLKEQKIPLTLIGIFSIKILPYSFKFCWAPYVDYYKLPVFSHFFCKRRSWMMISQTLLIFFISCFGIINVVSYLYVILTISIIIAFLGATYDITIQAYIIELFSSEDLANAEAFMIYGFRLGLLSSGIFSLVMANKLPWRHVFSFLACSLVPCTIMIYYFPTVKQDREKKIAECYKPYNSLSILRPYRDLFHQKSMMFFILVVMFYKVSDTYLEAMLIPFFIDIGFTKEDIAFSVKSIGMLGTIMGTMLGALVLKKLSIIKLLLLTEISAALTNIQFVILLYAIKNLCLLTFINFIESLSYGLSNITFITFIGRLCNKNFTATHFAMLSSISAISKITLSSTSGLVAQYLGWLVFFITSSVFSFPVILAIIIYLNQQGSDTNE